MEDDDAAAFIKMNVKLKGNSPLNARRQSS